MFKPQRRKIILINKDFQLRFCVYVVGWILIIFLVYPFIINDIFGFFEKTLKSFKVSEDAVEVMEAVRGELFRNLLILQFIYLGLTFLFTLFISHRIAGPLHKLKMYFEKTKTGNLSDRLTFRKRDYFKDVAEDFNSMIDGIKTQSSQDGVEEVSTALARIQNVMKDVNPHSRAELELAVEDLRKVRSRSPSS